MTDHFKKSLHRFPSIEIPQSSSSFRENSDYIISQKIVSTKSLKKSNKVIQNSLLNREKQSLFNLFQKQQALKKEFFERKQNLSVCQMVSQKSNFETKIFQNMKSSNNSLFEQLSEFKLKILNFVQEKKNFLTSNHELKLYLDKFINLFENQFKFLCQNIFGCILNQCVPSFSQNKILIEKKKQYIQNKTSQNSGKQSGNFTQKQTYNNLIRDDLNSFFTTIPSLQSSLNQKIKVVKQRCGEEESFYDSIISIKSLAGASKHSQHSVHDRKASQPSFEKILNLHDYQIKVLQEQMKDIKYQISRKSSKSFSRHSLSKKTKQVSFAKVQSGPSEQDKNIKHKQEQKHLQQLKPWTDNQNKSQERKSSSKSKKKINNFKHRMSIKAPVTKFNSKNTRSNFTLKVLDLNQELGTQNNQNLNKINLSNFNISQVSHQGKLNDHFWKKNQSSNSRLRTNSSNIKQKRKIGQQMVNFSIKKQLKTSKTTNKVTYKKINTSNSIKS